MKSVVFDVGNVLLKWDPLIPFRRHFADDASIRNFFEEVDFYNWNISLDAGRDWDEAVETLAAEFPHFDHAIRLFESHWHETIPHAIEPSVEILAALKSNDVPLYAITNFSNPRWEESMERFPFLKESFLDVVVSGREKLIKPKPEIFELSLSRNNLTADACVFIDDSAANIATASQLGFDTVHFGEDTDLSAELRQRGIAI